MNNSIRKLLYVDHTPFSGGAQLVLAEHIRELNRQKFDPYIACSDTVPELIDLYKSSGALVTIVHFPHLRRLNLVGIWQSIQAVRQLRDIIKRNNIDLVIANTTRASYFATLAAMGTGVPIIWWVRDFLYPKMLFNLLKPRVSKIMYVSKAIRDEYTTAEDTKAEVVYVASAIYRQLAKIEKSEIVAVRKQWGITAQDTVVGFMGRLVADKGIEEVIEAAKLLHTTHPKIKFLIVGTGKGQMNNVEDKVKSSVAANKLEKNVIFTGFQSNEALYYSTFDLFVLPTRDGEPFATSVVQAMMAGAAVIGSDAGGTPELVEHNVTGLLFTPKKATELSNAIIRLVENASLRRKLADAGKQRVLKYHREEVITDQVESIFDNVLS